MDYNQYRNDIREAVKTSQWKYLREKNNSYFNPKMNTLLSDYLGAIFPNITDWVYDKQVDKNILLERGATSIRKYRPDARSESLDMIIEFDGLPHFQSASVVLKDIERNQYFDSIGYTTIRIPYFIQLSSENINHYFSINTNKIFCEQNYSFFDSPNNDFGFDISPQMFCCMGMNRFINLLRSLPDSTKHYIKNDLDLVSSANQYGVSSIPDVYQHEYQRALLV